MTIIKLWNSERLGLKAKQTVILVLKRNLKTNLIQTTHQRILIGTQARDFCLSLAEATLVPFQLQI